MLELICLYGCMWTNICIVDGFNAGLAWKICKARWRQGKWAFMAWQVSIHLMARSKLGAKLSLLAHEANGWWNYMEEWRMKLQIALGFRSWKKRLVDFDQLVDQKVNCWPTVNLCKNCIVLYFLLWWTMLVWMNEWTFFRIEWSLNQCKMSYFSNK